MARRAAESRAVAVPLVLVAAVLCSTGRIGIKSLSVGRRWRDADPAE
jgi:hypothetical protein